MECGKCTECCTLCVVKELNKPAGQECKHCTDKCLIYESRPQSCRELKCAYRQTRNANIAMRPDNSGVVFEKLDDDLMFGSVNPKHKDFKHMSGQISAFLKEGINTVLVKQSNPIVYHLDSVSPESLLKRVYEYGNSSVR